MNMGKKNPSFKEISVTEFMTFLGLVYSMELIKLPNRRMYWADLHSTVLPNMDFSKHMIRFRFEEILSTMQMSTNTDRDMQVQDFINAVNEHLSVAITPGNVVTLDESMIKSFHRKLKGKIKIKRKPRPVGNEIKDMSDSRSNIVIKLEMYEGKEDMALKEYVGKYGATCATTLRLTENIHGSGRIVIAASWFGSVKTAIALKERGLYSIMLVKTAHKRYPREKMAEHDLSMGEWVAYTANLDGVDLQACSFQDLKLKQFISTCSTIIAGKPRKTKHHGDVPRPQVAECYLIYAPSIDIHNHVRTGSLGLEDVLLTLSPHVRQFTGIVGFLFTNAYLAYKYFKQEQSQLEHVNFKLALAERLVKYQVVAEPAPTRSLSSMDETSMVVSSHVPEKLAYPQPCFYCQHGYEVSTRKTTTFKCSFRKVPLHKSTHNLQCWQLHITHGLPPKRRVSKKE